LQSQPEQTTAFLQAIQLLGPRGPDDIRQAGLATLALPRAARGLRHVFRIHFLGGEEVPGAEGEDEEVVRLQDEGRGDEEPSLADDVNESGEMAVRAEALAERRFGRAGRAMRCAGSRAKPRRACRAGAAIAACARGAGLGRTSDEPCANPYATTAR